MGIFLYNWLSTEFFNFTSNYQELFLCANKKLPDRPKFLACSSWLSFPNLIFFSIFKNVIMITIAFTAKCELLPKQLSLFHS